MQLIPTIVTAALGFAAGTSAWAQASNGEWIANNVNHQINGRWIHESCTTRGTTNFRENGACKYWWDGKGTIHHGECGAVPDNNDAGNSVFCFI